MMAPTGVRVVARGIEWPETVHFSHVDDEGLAVWVVDGDYHLGDIERIEVGFLPAGCRVAVGVRE